MSTIETLVKTYDFNRGRTLSVLDAIEKDLNPQAILGWRPGAGRAHIAWQLTHIAITEELFATERLMSGTAAAFPELVPRFKGGSTPDDDIPTAAVIRDVLNQSRSHLVQTLKTFTDEQLSMKPEAFVARGWSLHDVLNVIAWHEPHHQGQSHLTLNLYRAQQAK